MKKKTQELMQEFEGLVTGHRDGHGFLISNDGQEIYIPANEMRAVLHRDRLRVRVVRYDKRGRPEGRVLDIVERSDKPIIGHLLQEGGVYLLAPEDKRYGQDVLIPADALGGAEVGQVVVVALTERPALYGQPVGKVIEVLGQPDDSGMEIEIAVRKFDVPHEFSEACLRQAERLPSSVKAAERKERIDLRDVPLLTIDGEDARDFDDAVYCEPAKVGRGKGWRLIVAIADVSHYVRTGDAIDGDAYDRATSVYFPRRVIPMLPEKLSNGLCSLNPGEDRLCMVADILIDAQGQIHAYQFYPAIMHSHARMTYTQVAAILTNDKGPEAQEFADLVPHLFDLHDVFRALLQARQQRGAIDLDTTETKIISDEQGRIERIEPQQRNDAHRLIEEAMLAANVCAAEFVLKHKRLALFRVHDAPTPEKVEILRQYLRALGIQADVSDEPKPAEFQHIGQITHDRPDHEQVHTMLLRSMSQAIYSPINDGHFGLAFEAYAHFTSPIRRYPDLLLHRVIKSILQEQDYALPALPLPGEAHEKMGKRLQARNKRLGRDKDQTDSSKQQSRNKKAQALQQGWEAAGLHCSANERRADEASRDVEAWLKCEYMKQFLGEEFSGRVSAVTNFGLFITLDDIYVDGLVHIAELGGEYFRFDELRQELRGERTGLRYGIGTRVQVQVARVDSDARKIDFGLIDGMNAYRQNKQMSEAEYFAPDAAAMKKAAQSRRKSNWQSGDKTASQRRTNKSSASKGGGKAGKKRD